MNRKNKNNSLKVRYGITLEQYETMLFAQGGECAICGEEPPTGKVLEVDHDHTTGEVRGLLCHRCNLALPHQVDEEWLRSAMLYLKR